MKTPGRAGGLLLFYAFLKVLAYTYEISTYHARQQKSINHKEYKLDYPCNYGSKLRFYKRQNCGKNNFYIYISS